jgi:hypothetical protein
MRVTGAPPCGFVNRRSPVQVRVSALCSTRESSMSHRAHGGRADLRSPVAKRAGRRGGLDRTRRLHRGHL